MSTLRYWSKRIRREVNEELEEAARTSVVMETPAVSFARVRTKPVSRVEIGDTCGDVADALRVFVGEYTVEVKPGFDAETLRRLVHVLESARGAR